MNEEVQLALEQIGLTESEIKVYLALLEIGASTTGPIIDKSQTANSKIYSVLEKLINKGLVTFFQQEGLKYYKATSPTQIKYYLKEKEREIRKQEEKIDVIMPDLQVMFTQKQPENEAIVFKGIKGIKAAFNDVVDSLEKGQKVNIMGVYQFGKQFMRLALYFQRIRSEKGIKANFLINQEAKEVAKEFLKYKPIEIRLMKRGITTPAVFLIYKDKVIINLGDEMVFFMIKSQKTADAFNVYFKEMWEVSKNTYFKS